MFTCPLKQVGLRIYLPEVNFYFTNPGLAGDAYCFFFFFFFFLLNLLIPIQSSSEGITCKYENIIYDALHNFHINCTLKIYFFRRDVRDVYMPITSIQHHVINQCGASLGLLTKHDHVYIFCGIL